MKIMISVGEASGDVHGASVANALKMACPDIELVGMGGQGMRAAGVEILYDIADLGVIGIVEVIRNLRRLFRLRDFLADYMREHRPDALVIIDYPGFNMRLAKIAKSLGIPVVAYISPSVWAWGKGRAKEVAETVERVAAIFPFEADAYRQAGANVTFVGHPLLDIVKPSMSWEGAVSYFQASPEVHRVLLMPGSRKQEILNLLPDILGAAEIIASKVPKCQFFLPVASTISQEMLQTILERYKVDVKLTFDRTYDLMNICHVAIAASGTATLETSLMKVPTVIIYRVAALTYLIGKVLVKIPNIGLPNIVAGRRILPELLQNDVTPALIAEESIILLLDDAARRQALSDLEEVHVKLGETGAVNRVANVILEVAGVQR